METVRGYTYLGDRVSARTRYGWVRLRDCDEMVYGMRFCMKLKWAVYKSYLRQAILPERKRHGDFADREIHGESNVCTTGQK